MRAVIKLSKVGLARYSSHLDLLRVLQRAIRRADIPAKYSKGFNPHMELSFATALSLGVESLGELVELYLDEDMDCDEIVRRLNMNMPEGMHVEGCKVPKEGIKAIAMLMDVAEYEITFNEDESEKIRAFMESESVIVTKRNKKGAKDIDIKQMVHDISYEGGVLSVTLTHKESGAVKPDLLLEAMGITSKNRILRKSLCQIIDGKPVEIFGGVL
ncbi:MAG: DUF2344 domain-containing protein [Clostridiales bacterium]|nr:DUF2344 domain-containing protein [Clostridiales bacterium]